MSISAKKSLKTTGIFLKNLFSDLNKYEYLRIVLFAVLVSLTASTYFFINDQILLYNDSRSHMDISRRVTDSLTPGVMQIGSVWLPLLHILMLPFIQIDFLWHTGLAGSIVSGFAFIIACVFIYKTLKLITNSNLISIFGFLLFTLNPNLLYLQAVPLDASLAVSASVVSLYYVLRWSKSRYLPDLTTAAFFAFLGSLTRYEVWFLLFAECLFVFAASFSGMSFREKFKKAEGSVVVFSFLAFFGVFLWFLYNYLGWNDPFYFLHNPSAHITQQREFEKSGLLPTKHNLFLSVWVTYTNIIENVGVVLTVVTTISLIFLILLKQKLKDKVYYLATLAPLGFILLTLYLGITVLFTKFYPSPGTTDKVFNVRYGIIALIPAVIITCTTLSIFIKNIKTRSLAKAIMILIIVGDLTFFYLTGTPAAIQDGETGISGFGQANEVVMSETVKNNCQDGNILISAGQDEIIMFESGFPMKQFIYEGSGIHWFNALANPTQSAKCIVVQKDGFVERGLNEKSNTWREDYDVIFNASDSTFIYKLKPRDFVVEEKYPEAFESEATASGVINNMYRVRIKPGDSLSKAYRQIVSQYNNDLSEKLTDKQKLFIENYLVLNLTPFKLYAGDEIAVSINELNTAETLSIP